MGQTQSQRRKDAKAPCSRSVWSAVAKRSDDTALELTSALEHKNLRHDSKAPPTLRFASALQMPRDFGCWPHCVSRLIDLPTVDSHSPAAFIKYSNGEIVRYV